MKQSRQKRLTKQMQVVHQIVCRSHSHPSADEVYRQAERVLPRISLGTVYHNLQRLVDDGKISVFFLNGRLARYDRNTTEHTHFVCQQCGRIEDLPVEHEALEPYLTPLTDSGYRIRAYSLVLHGTCPMCRAEPAAKLPVA